MCNSLHEFEERKTLERESGEWRRSLTKRREITCSWERDWITGRTVGGCAASPRLLPLGTLGTRRETTPRAETSRSVLVKCDGAERGGGFRRKTAPLQADLARGTLGAAWAVSGPRRAPAAGRGSVVSGSGDTRTRLSYVPVP